MDLDSQAKLSELVSGIVLVISFDYLAFQVWQNTQSLRSENYALYEHFGTAERPPTPRAAADGTA